jgi:VanZ family protein
MSGDFRVISRIFWLLVEFGLIAFSSTPLAEEAANYAYHFYAQTSELQGPGAGLDNLAEKGLHFVLFFALGTTLSYLISTVGWRKVLSAIEICLAAALGAEAIQLLFPTRTASIADVLLNLSSGSLAILLLQRRSEIPKKHLLVSETRH